jgi:diguanylate cyclase (GGDEF)-like protein
MVNLDAEGGSVARVRLTISHKFLAVMAALAPLIIAVALAGVVGLGSMKSEFDGVFADNIQTSKISTSLGADFSSANEIALRLATATDPGERSKLFQRLDQSVVPNVDAAISRLQALHSEDPVTERARIGSLARGWAQFIALRDTGALNIQRNTAGGRQGSDRLADQLAGIFDPFSAIIQVESALEATQAGKAHARSIQTYDTSRLLIWSIAIGACVLGLGSMLLLSRNVVPRIRRYSQFASAVASGDLSIRLASRGADELATLGRTLDDMVERREFVDLLQVTESEEVAHDLLRRQIERSVDGSAAVILYRNNVDDRLEATTPLREDSPLHLSLVDAKPRSCMALLFARPHSEDPDHEPLTRCEVCGKTGRRTTCEPLLVGGEVLGSVLLEHADPLQRRQTAAIRDSVAQAAPVLANLRSLTQAEFHASTDGLTGLANQRTVKATVKRMAAHASRTSAPLSAIMLDLDHFKNINDSFGHDRGDDVLAAAGSVLSDTVRKSDFVGRSGGEEFVVVLPDTDTQGALVVAEKIRAAMAGISISGVERPITASLGVATFPHHAESGEQLIRCADRALYVAKTNGRNRVEVAAALSEPELAAVSA